VTPSPRPELDRLVEQHIRSLRRYVRLRAGPLVRAKEPVSDLVQSVLREACATDGLERADENAFRGWLYKVATHKIISKNRYYGAERRSPAREEPASRSAAGAGQAAELSPSEQAERAEELARLAQALDELDDVDREILLLRRIFDVPTAEIATRTGLAESTVRGRLGRIMTELATRLA
jgi:RNA polymerase sigma-70 factor (ECF subfamily)